MKNSKRKLALNKRTIANLNPNQSQGILGGGPPTTDLISFASPDGCDTEGPTCTANSVAECKISRDVGCQELTEAPGCMYTLYIGC